MWFNGSVGAEWMLPELRRAAAERQRRRRTTEWEWRVELTYTMAAQREQLTDK